MAPLTIPAPILDRSDPVDARLQAVRTAWTRLVECLPLSDLSLEARDAIQAMGAELTLLVQTAHDRRELELADLLQLVLHRYPE